jgi:ubiquinone/menaquinone biosynthesis C-methylase UbiE
MGETKSYNKYTYDSKNILARFAHRTRFKKSVDLIPIKLGLSVLDYGSGDQKFLNTLQEKYEKFGLKLYGFEPFMSPIEDNVINTVKDLSLISKADFDIITCFEVLEHFNAQKQEEAIQKMISLLNKKSGFLIISVPIEIGFPSLIKNIRRALSSESDVYSFKNILKSIFSIPIPEHRTKDEYLSHMGFNHKNLEKIIKKNGTILSKNFSPIGFLGSNLNSQVFYKISPH